MSSNRLGKRALSSFCVLVIATVGCVDDADREAVRAPSPTAAPGIDSDDAHRASGDRDCDGVTDVDDPEIELDPDHDGDRWGDRCDAAPADPTSH
jgi:hypothetical protein